MKTPKPVLDRRRSIRVAEKLPFRIGHGNYETEAVTVNISVNGVLCIVDRDIPIMTQLKIALTLPTKPKPKTVTTKGVVVRKEKDAAGGHFYLAIYFSDIKPNDRQSLSQFIESRLPVA